MNRLQREADAVKFWAKLFILIGAVVIIAVVIK